MTHEDTESIAALDALGVAPQGDLAALALHVANCISCRRARDEYRRTAALLAFGLEPIQPPARLRRALLVASV